MAQSVAGQRRRVFGAKESAPPFVDLTALHARIGELTLENDFLEGALTKAGLSEQDAVLANLLIINGIRETL